MGPFHKRWDIFSGETAGEDRIAHRNGNMAWPNQRCAPGQDSKRSIGGDRENGGARLNGQHERPSFEGHQFSIPGSGSFREDHKTPAVLEPVTGSLKERQAAVAFGTVKVHRAQCLEPPPKEGDLKQFSFNHPSEI